MQKIDLSVLTRDPRRCREGFDMENQEYEMNEINNDESFESQRAVNEEMYNRGSWSDVMNGGSSVEYRAPVQKKKKRKTLTNKQKCAIGIGIVVLLAIIVQSGSSETQEHVATQDSQIQTNQTRKDRNGFDIEKNKTAEIDVYELSIPQYFIEETGTVENEKNYSNAYDDMYLQVGVYEFSAIGFSADQFAGKQEEAEPKLAKIIFDKFSSDDGEDDIRYSSMKTIDNDYKIYAMNYTAEDEEERADGTFYIVFDWKNQKAIVSLFLQDYSSEYDYAEDALSVVKAIKGI